LPGYALFYCVTGTAYATLCHMLNIIMNYVYFWQVKVHSHVI